MGLSTSLSIVRSHGGFITVYSEPGKGSIFKVYVPAIESEKITNDENKQLDLLRGHGERVLIVDDEKPIRSVTVTALEANGYTCTEAADGSEAIAAYVQDQDGIGVVIVDMMMPIMDGLATIHALRKINPQVKIIAVSGIGHEGRNPDDFAQTDAYLVKPYTTKRVLEAIRDVLAS